MTIPGNDSYSSPYDENSYSDLAPTPNSNMSFNQNTGFNQYETSDYSNKKSNWPVFLKDERNQIFFGIISLLLSFTTMILGIATSIYYLFILDKSVPKNNVAKWLNIAALAIPVLGIIATILFSILFVVVGLSTV